MEFEPFPKIPRLNRDIVVTEKLDGTNAAVLIEDLDETGGPSGDFEVDVLNRRYAVQAQSRNRLITPGKTTDNHGFAAWVQENAAELVRLLGPGRHFGEWWGQGIARNYGLDHKRFSLFNPDRYPEFPSMATNLNIYTVPVLYRGLFDQEEIEVAVSDLWLNGSVAAPGFMAPEGVIVYHTAARQLFKVTCEHDDKPKEVAAREAAKVAANGGGKVNF